MSSRTDSLLGQMTLDEKIAMVSGHDMWQTVSVDRLGIPALKVTDGPNGARGGSFSGKSSACFPCGSALASTWDPALVERVGEALAVEARAKGARMLLAPTVNIHRTLRAGRNFECFSEDPFLSARTAVAYVRGVQSKRVSVCIKHFVCNDQEHERMTISAELEDRALREIYLPPFEAAVKEAGARGVMSAYNRIRGTYACEHEFLLRDVLRGEYGFAGVLVSDWFGTQSTAGALLAGLDLEMPGPSQRRGEHLAAAIENGEVEVAALDAAVGHVLELLEWTNALDEGGPEEEAPSEGEAHGDLLREAAAASIVLLKNEGELLPLDRNQLRRVAVIGANAEELEPQGGGSAQVALAAILSPFEAIRNHLDGQAEVLFERGCDIHRSLPAYRRSATIEYFEGLELEGEAGARETVGRLHFAWLGKPTPDVSTSFSARITATYDALETGKHSFGLVSAGRSRLFLDGSLVVDNWTDQQRGSSFFGFGSKEVISEVELEAGHSHEIVIEYSALPMGGLGGLTVGCLSPRPTDMLERAVSCAAGCDAAIVVVGLNPDWESEGSDRKSIDLPGRQVELIEEVAAANPRTVVAVNAGSPTAMGWVERVPAALQLWYPGQEGAQALTKVLFGELEPGGRLPTTFPVREEDDPALLNYPGERGRVVYGEGIFVGYRGYDRRKVKPRFAFGHGLSYGEFSYGDATLSATESTVGEPLELRVPVTNVGSRAGSEVVQVYVRDLEASVTRPDKELKGFAKVQLAPGETAEVVIELDRRAFSYWDPQHGDWVIEPGAFEVLAGRSSEDIRTTASVVLRAGE